MIRNAPLRMAPKQEAKGDRNQPKPSVRHRRLLSFALHPFFDALFFRQVHIGYELLRKKLYVIVCRHICRLPFSLSFSILFLF